MVVSVDIGSQEGDICAVWGAVVGGSAVKVKEETGLAYIGNMYAWYSNFSSASTRTD